MEATRNAQVCVESDIGLKREQNEDTYLIVDHKTKDVDVQCYGTMYAVADGMGGHTGGEIASKMACQGLVEYYSENKLAAQDVSDFYRVRLRHLETIRSLHETDTPDSDSKNLESDFTTEKKKDSTRKSPINFNY